MGNPPEDVRAFFGGRMQSDRTQVSARGASACSAISTALASFALPVDGPSMGVTSELESARLSDCERLLASSRACGVPPPTFRIAALPAGSAARRLTCRKTIGAPDDEVVTKFSLVSD